MTQDLILQATASAFYKGPRKLTAQIRRVAYENQVPNSRHLSVEFDGWNPIVTYPPEHKAEIDNFEMGNHSMGIAANPILRKFLTSIPPDYMENLISQELETLLCQLF